MSHDPMKKKKEKVKKVLNGMELEKNDTLAIIIAAMTTILPFALVLIGLFYLLGKWFFQF